MVARRTSSNLSNVSDRANAILAHVLNEKKEAARRATEVSVEAALTDRPVIDFASGRDQARVLFVTEDQSVLEPDSQRSGLYRALTSYFDEIHVLVLTSREGAAHVDRRADGLWVYQACDGRGRLVGAGLAVAETHLIFNNSARPDVVVGIDPFVAGETAYEIAVIMERPLQLHLFTNVLDEQWVRAAPERKRQARQARRLLKRVASVRTLTELMKAQLQEMFPKLIDVSVLPQHYNFAGFRETTPVFDVHKKYPGYAIILLAIGPLTADSHLHDTFVALHSLLRNPRVALVVLGDGPAKHLFIEKVELLGVKERVIFVSDVTNLIAYMKTADLLVMTDTSSGSEITVLRAASAGLPAAMYRTDLRTDLFKDEVSALLCEPGDTVALMKKVQMFINLSSIRHQLAEMSQAVAHDRLHEDVETYYRALRSTIESIIVLPEEPSAEDALTESAL